MRSGFHAQEARFSTLLCLRSSLLEIVLNFILPHHSRHFDNIKRYLTHQRQHRRTPHLGTLTLFPAVFTPIFGQKSAIPAHPVPAFPSLDNLTYRELVDNNATSQSRSSLNNSHLRRIPYRARRHTRIIALNHG